MKRYWVPWRKSPGALKGLESREQTVADLSVENFGSGWDGQESNHKMPL